MATLTASSFSSTSSHVSYGTVSSGSNLKTGFKKMVSGKQTLTHNGLRALNSVDELRVRTMANSVARPARAKSVNSSRKTSGVIVCGSGMNLVFLGTEVGPWSKTGGLGDVLGGLPPAMAVSAYFSCLAALEAPRVLNLNSSKYFSGPYGEEVVFIVNDWHTALLPCYLKAVYKPRGIYSTAKVAFCIHNIAYQGRFAFADFGLLNLPDEFKSSFDFIDGSEKPVKGRKINWMKAGILESDKLLTVSPCYAEELVSAVEKGVADAKPLLKETLQAVVGLPVDRDIPVIGFIGRLEEQKGSDILIEAIPHLIKEDVQIIVLGTGKKPMEKQLEQLEMEYPDKARGVAKFSVPLAHMITAGADFMLVPSRFEPCGLIQLHAMRYGTCEVVDPADAQAITTTVTRALGTYGTPAFTEIISNCMAQDLSWKGPAKKWEQVLLSLGVARSEPGIVGEEIAPLAKENVATP
ncbi:unnamed protein product [Malus baccata var. baccata]